MYLGIDLGTSSIKLILMKASGDIVATESSAFEVSRPRPLWSEQNPLDWFDGMEMCINKLASQHDLTQVLSIGLSGQMHGATLLDNLNNVIRPAILWNDGRCAAECEQIEEMVPGARAITGNIVMPGFTAPKILWVKNHEPENFAKINKVLLPKDYLRFRLSGDFASDMSDSAGTSWLDVENRSWNKYMLSATGLDESHMPKLFEGNDITGHLSAELANKWGMKQVPIVAGAGDNAAGAIGLGIVNSGQAMLSLGTSGVFFAAADGFHANPDSAVHSFCHALPNSWHLMSVMLSAASCLAWYADIVVKQPVVELLSNLEQAEIDLSSNCYFLPYLAGERTPHNNPQAQGMFFGLTAGTTQEQMTHAVLEGVALAFADCAEALYGSGLEPTDITLIGGGARSSYWRQMIANVLNKDVSFRRGGDIGPALGAARLAQLAIETDKSVDEICQAPPLEQIHKADTQAHEVYQQRLLKFRALYQAIEACF